MHSRYMRQAHALWRRGYVARASGDAKRLDQRQDRIELRGLVFFGYHGVLSQERQDGQQFIVDADLHTDISCAATSDNVEDAVNYAEVHSTIKAVVEGTPQHLIEAVAEKTASAVLRQHAAVDAINVRIRKPAAPINGMFDYVAVNILRVRS